MTPAEKENRRIQEAGKKWSNEENANIEVWKI